MTGILSIQRRSSEERSNFWISLLVSILLHSAGLGLWILAASAMLALNQAMLADLNRAREAARARADQIPTVFVEVTPEQASTVPPPDTPNYSTRDSVAANPDVSLDTPLPKIDGSQDKVLRTADVLRPQPQPLQPSPPPPEAEPEPDPTPAQPADLGIGTPPPPRQRPRTLVEARMQQGLVGRKTRQEGGVRRPGRISLDAKASPYGAYDQALIEAVQKRWYDLLEDSSVALRSGRVVVTFTLQEDGRVTDLHVVEQDVGEILALYCSKAISDPAPFAPWPLEMRRILGRNHREVRFTFYYL